MRQHVGWMPEERDSCMSKIALVSIAIGIDMSGKKDVLDMHVGENESLPVFMSDLLLYGISGTDLQSRSRDAC